jgi:hypothetical protein
MHEKPSETSIVPLLRFATELIIDCTNTYASDTIANSSNNGLYNSRKMAAGATAFNSFDILAW